MVKWVLSNYYKNNQLAKHISEQWKKRITDEKSNHRILRLFDFSSRLIRTCLPQSRSSLVSAFQDSRYRQIFREYTKAFSDMERNKLIEIVNFLIPCFSPGYFEPVITTLEDRGIASVENHLNNSMDDASNNGAIQSPPSHVYVKNERVKYVSTPPQQPRTPKTPVTKPEIIKPVSKPPSSRTTPSPKPSSSKPSSTQSPSTTPSPKLERKTATRTNPTNATTPSQKKKQKSVVQDDSDSESSIDFSLSTVSKRKPKWCNRHSHLLYQYFQENPKEADLSFFDSDARMLAFIKKYHLEDEVRIESVKRRKADCASIIKVFREHQSGVSTTQVKDEPVKKQGKKTSEKRKIEQTIPTDSEDEESEYDEVITITTTTIRRKKRKS